MARKKIWIRILPMYCSIFIVCLSLICVGNDAVTVLLEHATIKDRTLVAIDAGHGGIDGGAVSISGIPESQINLQIAERLNDLLHLFGYQTLMLRSTDTSLHTDGETISAKKVSDLKERVRMVTDAKADLMLSIHQNTFSDKHYSGAQVFHHSDSKSIELAVQIQSNFIHTVNPGSNRRPKQAKGVYLMEHIPCPAVLIECGFLTNTQEEAQLRSAEYQKQICSVIAATVSAYWQ